MNELGKSLLRFIEPENAAIEARIERGIEANRKGDGEIRLVRKDGSRVNKASIALRQTTHEFQFGCNAFMLEQFPEQEQNRQYQSIFSNLFNLAVVPFYWSDLEPEDGALRFHKNSGFVYRRPEPDLVLEFCERHRITPKGHPLLWHQFRPTWLTHDQTEMRKRIRRRFEEIALAYADRIPIWDVCNEAQTIPAVKALKNDLPDHHVELAFELAAEYFPNCIKTYNDDNMWYRYSKTYTPVYLLMKHLLDHRYAVDALGLQFHMFDHLLGDADKYLNPEVLFSCLDLYMQLGVPVNFSEISIRGSRDLGDGDAFQCQVAQKLYRLWFSHAAVNGIIWWNLVDGTGAFAPLGSEEGENRLKAGLINFNFTPKPAYTALETLIKHEWNTQSTLLYAEDTPALFRGFYGSYEVAVASDRGSFHTTLQLQKGGMNFFEIQIP